jgi:hypothetical protein
VGFFQRTFPTYNGWNSQQRSNREILFTDAPRKSKIATFNNRPPQEQLKPANAATTSGDRTRMQECSF